MMSEKMDRSQVVIANRDALDRKDAEYWSRAPIEEKLQTITFLRECFYGEEATTRHPADVRRVQRVHTVLKLK